LSSLAARLARFVTDAVDQIEQLGKPQHNHGHRVITIQIGVENQIRLVADARDQRLQS
jgi:hypothetical protein